VFEGLIKRGMRLLEPIRALANLPASVVTIDLLAAVDRVVQDPDEDKVDFENSIPFFRAAALDRAGRHAEAWRELVAANRTVFFGLQKGLPELSAMGQASLASLRAHPGRSGRPDKGKRPVSLLILGPSGCGKTTVEKLVGALPGVKCGYENPIIENAVRWTFQTANLLTISVLAHLPAQLEALFRQIYFEELARRAGSAAIFTNTLSNCVYDDVARLVSVLQNVRFVFVTRALDDNLLRIFMRKYQGGTVFYGYDLKAARDHIQWFNQMMHLMADKFPDLVRILNYEDIVADPATALRTVAHLCDVEMPDITIPKISGDVGCASPYRKMIADALAS